MVTTHLIMKEDEATKKWMLEQMCEQLNRTSLPVFNSYFGEDSKKIGATIVGSARILAGYGLVCDVEMDELKEVTTVWRQDDGWLIGLEILTQ